MTPLRDVRIVTDDAILEGFLGEPEGSRGLVIFAHGSGSSRLSPRNRYVADVLQDGGMGTLLFGLLTEGEEELDDTTEELRFDVDLLTERLVAGIDWVSGRAETRSLNMGCFGSGPGAAAALGAAARRADRVAAVVSRSGRPDLAPQPPEEISTPTLLIVGGRDHTVLERNLGVLERLPGEKRLQVIRGATHLFEQPGALEKVAELAREWFVEHLGRSGRA